MTFSDALQEAAARAYPPKGLPRGRRGPGLWEQPAHRQRARRLLGQAMRLRLSDVVPTSEELSREARVLALLFRLEKEAVEHFRRTHRHAHDRRCCHGKGGTWK